MPGRQNFPKRSTRRLLTLLGALITAITACSPTAPDPPPPPDLPELPYAEELQSALDQALQQGQGAHDLGISAAVLVPGHQPWLGVTGNSHPGTPLTADMLFNMGSITKSFEAALALQLAQEGALDLDQPLSTWLPAYPHVDDRITVRQLLNHTSGLYNLFEHPDFPWVSPTVDYQKQWPTQDVFQRFVAAPYGPPGTVQHYSSTNYLLLTAILAHHGPYGPYGPRASSPPSPPSPPTPHPVPHQITQRLLNPLQLRNTHITMGDLPPPPNTIAHPWIDLNGDGRLQDLSGIPQTWIASMTHPTLYATPADMAHWMAALYGEKRVLSPDSLSQMLTLPQNVQPDPQGVQYGLGVVDYTKLLGIPVYGHGGSALGYSAAALYLPQQNIALAWSINTGESPPDLANDLMNNTWSALSGVILDQTKPRSNE